MNDIEFIYNQTFWASKDTFTRPTARGNVMFAKKGIKEYYGVE